MPLHRFDLYPKQMLDYFLTEEQPCSLLLFFPKNCIVLHSEVRKLKMKNPIII